MTVAMLKQLRRRLLGPVWFGVLRRTTPLSDHWGYDRGTPIDRYYIAQFLAARRADIRGRALEVKDGSYTTRFGTAVSSLDVLDIDSANPQATVIADLAAADSVPSDTFDCFILTQTLQFIYDTRAALAHAHRILRPHGVLLATVPAVSKMDRRLTDYWRFTKASCASLWGEVFGPAQVSVCTYGNVLTSMAFLTGLAAEELSHDELEHTDQQFPVLITIRAEKAGEVNL